MFHVKHRLLADTKPAENLIQHIDLNRRTQDLPQRINSILQLNRNQLHGLAIVEFVPDCPRCIQAIVQKQLLPEVRYNSGFEVEGGFAKSSGDNLLLERFDAPVIQC